MQHIMSMLIVLVAIGCSLEPNKKSMQLGDGYILVRLNGAVYVFRSGDTNDAIPSKIYTLGYNDRYIVATAVTNAMTNYWVVEKKTAKSAGPLNTIDYNAMKATNDALKAARLKDVWEY